MLVPQIKKELLEQCQNYASEREYRIKLVMSQIKESLSTETKSTAGDKHETGRAMLQLEREKAGKQLAEAQKLIAIVSKINLNPSEQICLGSLVITAKANYFISISVGKLIVNETEYIAIAPNTPIGKLLLGKSIDQYFDFNGEKIRIEKVY